MMYMMVACPKCGKMIERYVGYTVEEMRTLEKEPGMVLSQDYDEPFTCPHCGETINSSGENSNTPGGVAAFID